MSRDESIINTCPHCGRELSPWEQVLLSVDRALMCKSCWYRIILDAFHPAPHDSENDHIEEKDE